MHDALHPNAQACGGQHLAGPLLCHPPHTNHHGEAELLHNFTQSAVTLGQERVPLGCRQLWGGQVLPVVVHEDEWTQIVNKAVLEKPVWFHAQFFEESPEPSAAHFSLGAPQTHNGPLGMLVVRMTDLSCDLQPIDNGPDLTERNLKGGKT